MTDYLRCRRGRYFVQIRRPLALANSPLFPRPLVERYLNTSEAREARERAPGLVDEIRAEFKAALAGAVHAGAALDHIFATMKRQAYDALADGAALPVMDLGAELLKRGVTPTIDGTVMDAQGAVANAIHNARHRFTHAAPAPAIAGPWRAPVKPGEAVELLAHLESYLATLEGVRKPKVIAMRRGTIKRFLAGLPMLADVTRPAVQRWHEANKDKAPETLKHSRDDMRGYWKWLRAHGKLAGLDSENNDPFDASKLSIAAESDEAKLQRERKSFTPAEISEAPSTSPQGW